MDMQQATASLQNPMGARSCVHCGIAVDNTFQPAGQCNHENCSHNGLVWCRECDIALNQMLGKDAALRKLASEQKLSSTIVKTKYIDVGNPEGYNYAQEIFNR